MYPTALRDENQYVLYTYMHMPYVSLRCIHIVTHLLFIPAAFAQFYYSWLHQFKLFVLNLDDVRMYISVYYSYVLHSYKLCCPFSVYVIEMCASLQRGTNIYTQILPIQLTQQEYFVIRLSSRKDEGT